MIKDCWAIDLLSRAMLHICFLITYGVFCSDSHKKVKMFETGFKIFHMFGSHLQIVAAWRVTWTRVHTEDQQLWSDLCTLLVQVHWYTLLREDKKCKNYAEISGATTQKLVSWELCTPGVKSSKQIKIILMCKWERGETFRINLANVSKDKIQVAVRTKA